MSRNSEVDTAKTRIVNLDFLRGLFIILALDQHFTYYINMWYVAYFRDSMALSSTYKIHLPMIGHQVPTDGINHLLALIFTPWVSQIYLTLASFNLARKSQSSFRETLDDKLKMFGFVFLFFVLENFIVAPNLGEAISFYPIMLWMIVMSFISIVYSYTGIRGVIGLTLLSLMRWIIPIELFSNFFQSFMKYQVHPGFEYDARIEYFATSGCLGFIMGYVHYHKPNLKNIKDYYFILAGLVLIAFYFAYGDKFIVDPADVFRSEHDLAQTFSGTMYILGVQAIVISAFLWLEKKSIRINMPVLNWVGMNSLFIFAFHRIFFVRVLAPLSILTGTFFNRTLGASCLETIIYVGLTIGACYFIKATRMGELILKR